MFAADKTAALALTLVSRETEARLDRYVDLLAGVQAKTNLGGAIDDSEFVDAAHRRFVAAPGARSVSQALGPISAAAAVSPALVLACALADTSGAMVHLIERNARRLPFLRGLCA